MARHMLDLVGNQGVYVELDDRRSLRELTELLQSVCARAEERRTPSVIVLRLGTVPPAERSWPGDVGVQDVNRWERAVRRLEGLGVVTIAVASGTCGGPTLDVLLAADYRIATINLQLLLPVNDGHFWPGMAVHRLVHQVGVARARQIVLWGDELSARRALDIGLVDEITADAAEAIQAAVVLLGRAAGSDLRARRQLLLEAASTPFEDALGPHLAACDRELRRAHPRDGRTRDIADRLDHDRPAGSDRGAAAHTTGIGSDQ
ncbi:enoyl-CoA-hydratase DpgB [Micromonospora okii]|uniref:enoyl-CoA-hydratase DpgB n=1 Tax=Micromonospora okii TaxID=1182970 RepID=UPI001E3C935E|nr:enoyl-CoA-hydratase DpgB [Micromonospora okii]